MADALVQTSGGRVACLVTSPTAVSTSVETSILKNFVMYLASHPLQVCTVDETACARSNRRRIFKACAVSPRHT